MGWQAHTAPSASLHTVHSSSLYRNAALGADISRIARNHAWDEASPSGFETTSADMSRVAGKASHKAVGSRFGGSDEAGNRGGGGRS